MPAGEQFCSEECAELFAEWSERQVQWDLEHEQVGEPDDAGRDPDGSAPADGSRG